MKLKSIATAFSTLSLAFLLSSCLKNKNDVGLISDEGSIVVEIPEVASLGSQSLPISLSPATEDVVFFTLAAHSPRNNKPNSDIRVKLTSSAISGYDPIPAAALNIPAEFVIPKGQGKVNVTIPVNKAPLDPSKSYAIRFTIASVSEGIISELGKTIEVYVSVKNQYDGIYSVVSGKVTRYTAPGVPAGDALSGNLAGNPDVYMVTVNANTVTIPVAGQVGSLQWAAGNNSAVAGIDGLRIAVNQTTNQVTVTSLGNATLANWAGSTPGITYNRYDPATKTFYLAFNWNPTANVREYEIVLKYKGPR